MSVIVTGGASGIGAAVCRSLGLQGWHVLVADKDLKAASVVAEDVGGEPRALDVSDVDSWRSLASSLAEEGRKIDALVLNAGLAGGGSAADLDVDRYRVMFGVNVDGVAFGIDAFAGAMRERGTGSIVVTASMAGLTGVPFDPVYAMTKHAVIGLVRSCADGFARDGVRLQAVCPGLADTPLLGRAKEQMLASAYPLLTAEDVAEVLSQCVRGERPDVVTVLQAGRDAMPFRFAGVPGPAGGGIELPRGLELGRSD